MTMLKCTIAALGLGLIAAPATAGQTVDTVPTDTNGGHDRAETGDGNRIICRRESVTGSRLGTNRRCMTAAEWASVRQDMRERIEHAQAYRPTNEQ